MNYKWLQKNNNDKLIIFFNGWGMDENSVSHLNCGDYDVLVLFDYNNLNLDTDIPKYKEKYIIAWSMGVMISGINETEKIRENSVSYTAICGTPFPINDNYGIPERIYDLTVKGFSELSSKKFISRMFNGEKIPGVITKRTLESQKSELIELKKYTPSEKVKFDKVIVGENDKIIPTKNQTNYWTDKDVNIIFTPTGHYPFLMYNDWAELVEICRKV